MTGKEVSYVPVTFFAARVLVSCEFQYTAENVGGSAVLAIRLLTSPRLIRCFLFPSFKKSKKYLVALLAATNAPILANCQTDLQGILDEALADPKNAANSRP